MTGGSILGSATPSLESYHNALVGKHRMLRLTARVGGGALPLHEIPSAAVALGGADHPAHRLEESLRSLATPVVARIHEGRLLLDMRTVDEREVAPLAACIESIVPA